MRKLHWLLALALFGCGRSETPPPSSAILCAEAVREDGTLVASATFTVDGESFSDCASVDPSVSHELRAGEVKGLMAPGAKLIAANVLKADKPSSFRFVYRQDMRQVTLRALNPFDRVVAKAVIKFDGRELGMGEVTTQYDATTEHGVSFGRVEGLTAPAAIQIKAGQYADNSAIEAKYTGDSLAEVCFTPMNYETGEAIDVAMEINGNRIGGENPKCATVDVRKPIRANGSSAGGGTGSGGSGGGVTGLYSSEFKIPPNTLKVGESRSFDYLYVSYADAQSIDMDTTPVLGEVFIVDVHGNRHSFGWPLVAESVSIFFKPMNIGSIEFGSVNGHETAKPLVWKQEFLQTNNREPMVGFYDFSSLGLYCIRAEGEWGGSVIPRDARIDQVAFTRDYSGRFACEALNPADPHTITWGMSSDWIPPAPSFVQAKTIQAGGRFDLVGTFAYGSQTEEDKSIRVRFKNAFGDNQNSSHTVNGVARNGSEAFWSGKSSKEPTVVIHWVPEPYLLAPPDLTIDIASLSKGDSNYDPTSRYWTWDIVLPSAAPSARVCARAENHDGSPLAIGPMFNGLNSAGWEEGKDLCRVLPVAGANLVTFGYLTGYRSPPPLYIAANKLSANSTVVYTGTFVLEMRVADVCVGTSNAQGEIFFNGRSVGFAEVLGASQVCLPVDIRKINTFTFSTEGGVTPPPKVFQANDPANPNGPGSLAWQSHTEILAVY